MLGEIEEEEMDGIPDSVDMNLGKFWETGTGKPGVLRFMSKESDTTEPLNSENIVWIENIVWVYQLVNMPSLGFS